LFEPLGLEPGFLLTAPAFLFLDGPALGLDPLGLGAGGLFEKPALLLLGFDAFGFDAFGFDAGRFEAGLLGFERLALDAFAVGPLGFDALRFEAGDLTTGLFFRGDAIPLGLGGGFFRGASGVLTGDRLRGSLLLVLTRESLELRALGCFVSSPPVLGVDDGLALTFLAGGGLLEVALDGVALGLFGLLAGPDLCGRLISQRLLGLLLGLALEARGLLLGLRGGLGGILGVLLGPRRRLFAIELLALGLLLGLLGREAFLLDTLGLAGRGPGLLACGGIELVLFGSFFVGLGLGLRVQPISLRLLGRVPLGLQTALLGGLGALLLTLLRVQPLGLGPLFGQLPLALALGLHLLELFGREQIVEGLLLVEDLELRLGAAGGVRHPQERHEAGGEGDRPDECFTPPLDDEEHELEHHRDDDQRGRVLESLLGRHF